MQLSSDAGTLDSGSNRYDPERITRGRRGLWVAGVVELLVLLAFVALFNFVIPPFEQTLSGVALVAVGLVVSLIPALIWLLFFYQLDRYEPEPKHGVLMIFVLAGLITAAVARPLLRSFFAIDAWLYDAWWTHLLGGVLVVGMMYTAAIYISIRYGIYFEDEFDERIDGIIYGTAAGLGVATVLNAAYIIANGGVDLDIGSMRMVVNALAYASFGGVLGYFLGQTRFEKTPFYYLPAGIALAATLNGLFFFLEDRVTATGLQSSPENALILASVFALVILSLLFWLINRANAETLALARQEAAPLVPAAETQMQTQVEGPGEPETEIVVYEDESRPARPEPHEEPLLIEPLDETGVAAGTVEGEPEMLFPGGSDEMESVAEEEPDDEERAE